MNHEPLVQAPEQCEADLRWGHLRVDERTASDERDTDHV
eukprot:CAMPEP_0204297184 /NCGR_PEP_ID=MMETSP0468-20130131/72726_1 /ASSEMBLY_ACC=CAM_ASM_000383 /TAXON_ID=2969 /ORGANISM="Oxyrrhis marina" /LENGTH=38 /DNA_ID= /DNA_START= /DNA_END= /DNA_ORIENTATION=